MDAQPESDERRRRLKPRCVHARWLDSSVWLERRMPVLFLALDQRWFRAGLRFLVRVVIRKNITQLFAGGPYQYLS